VIFHSYVSLPEGTDVGKYENLGAIWEAHNPFSDPCLLVVNISCINLPNSRGRGRHWVS
jgi:hypothetical protein